MNASPIDVASECDRLWFEKHPGAASYVRRRYPGELGPAEDGWPPDEYPWIEVLQLAPGTRARLPRVFSEMLSTS